MPSLLYYTAVQTDNFVDSLQLTYVKFVHITKIEKAYGNRGGNVL